MSHMYAKAFSTDDRMDDRYSVVIDTTMRELGEADRALRVVDISARGFAGLSPHPFPSPCIVAIMLPGVGDVKARVAWVGEGRVGGEFLAPISLQGLTQALDQISRQAM
jgi:hypothetical protein